MKKVIVVVGSLKTIPPVSEDYPGIVDLIDQPLRKIKNYEVQVLSLWDDHLKDIGYDTRVYCHVKPKIEGILHRLPYLLKKVLLDTSDTRLISYYSGLFDYLIKENPEVVITHVRPVVAQIAHLACPKATHIFYYHGSILDEAFSPLQWKIFKKQMKGLIVICDINIHKLIVKFGSVDLETKTIINAIDNQRYNIYKSQEMREKAREKYNLESSDLVYISAGRIDPEKGLVELLESFSLYYRENHHARLIIAGDPAMQTSKQHDFFAHIKELAQKLFPEDIVKFSGWLSKQGLVELYALADVGVLASIRHEGNPLFLMEAMACGVPCISTNVGGVPQIIRSSETGILIDPGDLVQNLLCAFRKIEDFEKRKKIGNHAAKYAAEFFTYDRVADEIESFIDKLLSK